MRPRRVLTRLVFLLAAVLQTAAPGAVALADGWLRGSAAAGVSSAHVEALGGGSECPAAHVDDCTLCRALSLTGLPHRVPTLVVADAAGALPAPLGAVYAAAGAERRLPPSRAPPSV